VALYAAAALAAGCVADSVGDGSSTNSPLVDDGSVTVRDRIIAANRTANGVANACTAIRPFYWEIGSANRRLAGGSVDEVGNPTSYGPDTRLNLGSASKWIYAAYVAERFNGVLTDDDIASLTQRSGYANLGACYPHQTVRGCFRYEDNELFVPDADGLFAYNGGHMQQHAVALGLGPLSRTELAAEVRNQLGRGTGFGYSLAMPAGGANGTPKGVAAFLRRLMNDQLVLGSMLGSNAVCTNPDTCPPGTALHSPAPPDEDWHYSLGHWVEDDPTQGDGSFSSPGTLGFYPWISSDRKLYGLVARDDGAGEFVDSLECGRLIRAAWNDGVALRDAARIQETTLTELAEPTPEAAAGEIREEVLVSPYPIVDFEFDWGRDGVHCPSCNSGDGNDRLIFTDREYNMWLAYVDPATGDFIPEDGQGIRVDRRGAFATDFGNGPEWMFSTAGSQIVYTKYFPRRRMNTFTASVAIATQLEDGSWDAGIVQGGVKKQSPSGTLDLDDPAPRINYQDFAKRNVYWRVADDPDSEQLMPIANQTGGGSRRWVPGTRKVIFSGSAEPDDEGVVYQQVFIYDTDTEEFEQLTFDPLTKWGAFMWQAPEYDGEYLFFTVSDRTSLAIYRKLTNADGEPEWTVINEVEMPAALPYIWSPEPFIHRGRSYIFFQLSSDPIVTDMSVPTQIAMTGIDPNTPSFRMLTNDSSTRRVRMDPEHYITEQGPFIYYNRYIPKTETRPVINDGVWRVDTELGPP
jgi:hypothetical protein